MEVQVIFALKYMDVLVVRATPAARQVCSTGGLKVAVPPS
jgi:hypothetical protein